MYEFNLQNDLYKNIDQEIYSLKDQIKKFKEKDGDQLNDLIECNIFQHNFQMLSLAFESDMEDSMEQKDRIYNALDFIKKDYTILDVNFEYLDDKNYTCRKQLVHKYINSNNLEIKEMLSSKFIIIAYDQSSYIFKMKSIITENNLDNDIDYNNEINKIYSVIQKMSDLLWNEQHDILKDYESQFNIEQKYDLITNDTRTFKIDIIKQIKNYKEYLQVVQVDSKSFDKFKSIFYKLIKYLNKNDFENQFFESNIQLDHYSIIDQREDDLQIMTYYDTKNYQTNTQNNDFNECIIIDKMKQQQISKYEIEQQLNLQYTDYNEIVEKIKTEDLNGIKNLLKLTPNVKFFFNLKSYHESFLDICLNKKQQNREIVKQISMQFKQQIHAILEEKLQSFRNNGFLKQFIDLNTHDKEIFEILLFNGLNCNETQRKGRMIIQTNDENLINTQPVHLITNKSYIFYENDQDNSRFDEKDHHILIYIIINDLSDQYDIIMKQIRFIKDDIRYYAFNNEQKSIFFIIIQKQLKQSKELENCNRNSNDQIILTKKMNIVQNFVHKYLENQKSDCLIEQISIIKNIDQIDYPEIYFTKKLKRFFISNISFIMENNLDSLVQLIFIVQFKIQSHNQINQQKEFFVKEDSKYLFIDFDKLSLVNDKYNIEDLKLNNLINDFKDILNSKIYLNIKFEYHSKNIQIKSKETKRILFEFLKCNDLNKKNRNQNIQNINNLIQIISQYLI